MSQRKYAKFISWSRAHALAISSAFVLAIPTVSGAAETWLSATITAVYPLSDGSVVITFSAQSPSCTNGGSPKYHFLSVGYNGVTQPGLKNLFTVAMLAFSMGKVVAVNFDDSTPNCFINRIYLGS